MISPPMSSPRTELKLTSTEAANGGIDQPCLNSVFSNLLLTRIDSAAGSEIEIKTRVSLTTG